MCMTCVKITISRIHGALENNVSFLGRGIQTNKSHVFGHFHFVSPPDWSFHQGSDTTALLPTIFMSLSNKELEALAEEVLSTEGTVEEEKKRRRRESTSMVDEQRKLDLALHSAVKGRGNLTEAKRLLKAGADPNYLYRIDHEGTPALFHAIEAKRHKIVELLLQYKANPDVSCKHPFPNAHRSMLYAAATKGCLLLVRALLPHIKQFNPECDPDNDNSLARAIFHENFTMVELLHKSGVRMPFRTQEETIRYAHPLASHLQSKTIRTYLIKNGMHIPNGYLTEICRGTYGDRMEDEVRDLCERGFNVNPCWKRCDNEGPMANGAPRMRNCSCDNPLLEAFRNRVDSEACISILLKFGADPNGNWKFLGRPLYEVVVCTPRLVDEDDYNPNRLRMVEMLLEAGADPTHGMFETANHSVLSHVYDVDLYRLLLKYGAVAYPKDLKQLEILRRTNISVADHAHATAVRTY